MTEEETGPPQANWRFVNRLPIQDHMADLVRKTKVVAEMELKTCRRKLRKLQYGS